MADEYTCPFHNVKLYKEVCPQCRAEYDARTKPEEMTAEERAAELTKWFDNILTMEFGKLHKRIEELVGRPVFTHEMASKDALVTEVLSGKSIGIGEVIQKATDTFGKDKTIVVEY